MFLEVSFSSSKSIIEAMFDTNALVALADETTESIITAVSMRFIRLKAIATIVSMFFFIIISLEFLFSNFSKYLYFNSSVLLSSLRCLIGSYRLIFSLTACRKPLRVHMLHIGKILKYSHRSGT